MSTPPPSPPRSCPGRYKEHTVLQLFQQGTLILPVVVLAVMSVWNYKLYSRLDKWPPYVFLASNKYNLVYFVFETIVLAAVTYASCLAPVLVRHRHESRNELLGLMLAHWPLLLLKFMTVFVLMHFSGFYDIFAHELCAGGGE